MGNKDEGTGFIDGCRNGLDYSGNSTCELDTNLYNALYDFFYDKADINDPNCFKNHLYKKWLRANWGAENVAQLHRVYNSSSRSEYSTNYWAGTAVVTDFILYCTQSRAAELLVQQGPVFEYYFQRTPSLAPFADPDGDPDMDYLTDGFGACHGCEIPFVFQRSDSMVFGINGTGELALAESIGTHWTNFAWSGDPNDRAERWSVASAAVAPWPSRSSGAVLSLDATAIEALVRPMDQHPRSRTSTDFWNGYFEESGWFPNVHGRSGHSVTGVRPRRSVSSMHQDVQVCDNSEVAATATSVI